MKTFKIILSEVIGKSRINETEGYEADGKLFKTKDEAKVHLREMAFEKYGYMPGSYMYGLSSRLLTKNYDLLIKELKEIDDH